MEVTSSILPVLVSREEGKWLSLPSPARLCPVSARPSDTLLDPGGRQRRELVVQLTRPLFPQALAPPGPSPLQGSSASGWDGTGALEGLWVDVDTTLARGVQGQFPETWARMQDDASLLLSPSFPRVETISGGQKSWRGKYWACVCSQGKRVTCSVFLKGREGREGRGREGRGICWLGHS